MATELRKITRAQCLIFDLPALQEATDNFSDNNKLGEGGYGIVYKVRLAPKNVREMFEMYYALVIKRRLNCLQQLCSGSTLRWTRSSSEETFGNK